MKDYIRYLRDEMRYFIKIILTVVFSIFLFAGLSHAEKVTFVKEYTYQASELDSKASCRTISLEMVKRLLLEELGTYLISETEVKDFQLTKDKVVMLTAGIVQTEILNEKWDGERYYLKARVKADPKEVAAAVDRLRKDTQKSKELEAVKKKADEAFKQIEKLKKELEAVKADTNKQKEYAKAADILSATDWYEKGYNLGISGNYKEALNAFNKAIELNPQDAAAYSSRGLTYYFLGKYQQAIKAFNKAIQIDPQLDIAYNNRGITYAELGNYKQAINDFTKSIELNPQRANLYYNRGLAYHKLGNYQQAINDYTKAIQGDVIDKLIDRLQDTWVYSNRGLAYHKLGNHQQAINDFNKAIELDPQNAAAYSGRGNAYNDLGNYQQAINDFNKAIQLYPQFTIAYYERGLAYDKLGNYQQAIKDLQVAARLGLKDAQDLLINIGERW